MTQFTYITETEHAARDCKNHVVDIDGKRFVIPELNLTSMSRRFEWDGISITPDLRVSTSHAAHLASIVLAIELVRYIMTGRFK